MRPRPVPHTGPAPRLRGSEAAGCEELYDNLHQGAVLDIAPELEAFPFREEAEEEAAGTVFPWYGARFVKECILECQQAARRGAPELSSCSCAADVTPGNHPSRCRVAATAHTASATRQPTAVRFMPGFNPAAGKPEGWPGTAPRAPGSPAAARVGSLAMGAAGAAAPAARRSIAGEAVRCGAGAAGLLNGAGLGGAGAAAAVLLTAAVAVATAGLAAFAPGASVWVGLAAAAGDAALRGDALAAAPPSAATAAGIKSAGLVAAGLVAAGASDTFGSCAAGPAALCVAAAAAEPPAGGSPRLLMLAQTRAAADFGGGGGGCAGCTCRRTRSLTAWLPAAAPAAAVMAAERRPLPAPLTATSRSCLERGTCLQHMPSRLDLRVGISFRLKRTSMLLAESSCALLSYTTAPLTMNKDYNTLLSAVWLAPSFSWAGDT